MPYERAWALADSDDERAMREALDILLGLGAQPLADRVRHRLRDKGATGIPTGPRTATAAHPSGLTHRQAEVLDLMTAGLGNADIADRLYISKKTV